MERKFLAVEQWEENENITTTNKKVGSSKKSQLNDSWYGPEIKPYPSLSPQAWMTCWRNAESVDHLLTHCLVPGCGTGFLRLLDSRGQAPSLLTILVFIGQVVIALIRGHCGGVLCMQLCGLFGFKGLKYYFMTKKLRLHYCSYILLDYFSFCAQLCIKYKHL